MYGRTVISQTPICQPLHFIVTTVPLETCNLSRISTYEQLHILAAHPGLKASWRVRELWYEDPWNFWNDMGTVLSFLAFLAPKKPDFIVRIHPHIFTF